MKKLVAFSLCLLLLCGCGKKDAYVPTGDGLSFDENYTGPIATRPQEETEQELTLTYYPDRSLNPLVSDDFTNRTLFSLMYQSLFVVDREYQIQPMLCGKYSMAEDMLSYVFYVDENATFSDGSKVRAQDVVASLNTAKAGKYYSGRFTYISAVSVAEDGGVLVELSTACENLPILLDIPIVPESHVDIDRPLGSGPYYLDTGSNQWVLRRRTNWWCSAQMAVTAETISLLKATSNTQIRDNFQFAELNLVCADPCSDNHADYRCDFELWDCESGVFTYLAFSDMSTVFDTPEIRAAVTHALDRDAIAEEHYRGFGRAATLPASPLSPYYSEILAAKYDYAPEKFTQAVQDAGKTGNTVVLLVNSDDSLRVRAARSVGEMLTAGGLIVTMKEVGGSAYVNAIKNREFDLYMGKTKLPANMDLSAFFATNGSLSYGGTEDPAAFNLCKQALENYGNYYTLHQQVMDNGLLCPVVFCSQAVYATRGTVTGLTPSRDNICYYSIGKTMENAYIRPETQ